LKAKPKDIFITSTYQSIKDFVYSANKILAQS